MSKRLSPTKKYASPVNKRCFAKAKQTKAQRRQARQEDRYVKSWVARQKNPELAPPRYKNSTTYRKPPTQAPNDRCLCGSMKKFKRCCKDPK